MRFSKRAVARTTLLGRGSRRPKSRWWHRLRAPLQVVAMVAVLLGINLYVVYYRNGTSLPALLKRAETGRLQSAKLLGPLGTPPQPHRPLRKNQMLPPLPDYPRVVEWPLQVGDSLPELLSKAAMPHRAEVWAALQGVLDPGGFGPGQTLSFFFDHEDRLHAVDYRLTPALAYHLERVQTGSAVRFVPERQTQARTFTVARVEVALRGPGDLQAAFVRSKETVALAARVYEVLACELNLYAEAQPGDTLRVLVEKEHLGSRFYRYGRLLALEYRPGAKNRRGLVRAFLRSEGGPLSAGAAPGAGQHFFTERGESLVRSLCKAPLLWSRTNFSTPPQAPVLRKERGRVALDFPAEAGMPVVALGAGKVRLQSGRPGKPVSVSVVHAGGIETSYFPLVRAARGLVDGQTVKMRQVLGYLAKPESGEKARLRLAAKQGGRLVDPNKLRVTREPGLPENQRAHFLERTDDLAEQLSRTDEAVVQNLRSAAR